VQLRSIDNLDPTPSPGVYFLHLKAGSTLEVWGLREDRLLYVGVSSNLAERQFDTHFHSGQTGWSTVRRSLGAILKEQLALKAIPRNGRVSPTNCRNYEFAGNGEAQLTDWMERHLDVAVMALDEGWIEAEKRLIAELQPPLCLKGWPNPLRSHIKALRKVCIDEARSFSVPEDDQK